MLFAPVPVSSFGAGPHAVGTSACRGVRAKPVLDHNRFSSDDLPGREAWVATTLAVAGTLAARRRIRGCSVAQHHRQRAQSRVARRQGPDQAPWIDGIKDIEKNYDAFLIDLWGVIHNGSESFPWALEALEELQKCGKPVVFLSNSSRRRETNIAALAKLGVGQHLYVDLITSGDETWQALAQPSADGASAVAASLPQEVLGAETVLTFGNGADDAEYLAGLAPRRSAMPEEAQLLLARGCSTLCAADGDPKPATWPELEDALEAAARRGVPMLVANPDSVRPDGADSPMPGRLARRYLELGGPAPHFVGKPHRAIFDTALARLRAAGVPEGARICMIGDSAWHDVRGARGAGLDVVLLCSGVHSTALGIEQAPAQPRRPDAERLAGFLGALSAEESPTYVASAFRWSSNAVESSTSPSGHGHKSSTVITCGLACMDLAQQVDTYPDADAKIRAEGTQWLGGGNAANTACALSRLGTSAYVLSKVGDDAMGYAILDGLHLDGVDTRFVERAPNSTSAFTSIIVDRAGSTRTCINSPMLDELSAEEVKDLLAANAVIGEQAEGLERRMLGLDVDLVHFDLRHPNGAIALAEATSKVAGVRMSIDLERPRPGVKEILPLCNAIFCNSTFPQQYTGATGLPGALAEILDQNPRADFIVATRGERGSLCLARKSSTVDIGEEAVAEAGVPVTCCHGSFGDYHTLACDAWPLPSGASVADSTGAGDVFIAGVLHAWLAGQPLSMALATGSYVATNKVQCLGARLGPDFNARDLPFS